jgi:hypothetical protein
VLLWLAIRRAIELIETRRCSSFANLHGRPPTGGGLPSWVNAQVANIVPIKKGPLAKSKGASPFIKRWKGASTQDLRTEAGTGAGGRLRTLCTQAGILFSLCEPTVRLSERHALRRPADRCSSSSTDFSRPAPGRGATISARSTIEASWSLQWRYRSRPNS